MKNSRKSLKIFLNVFFNGEIIVRVFLAISSWTIWYIVVPNFGSYGVSLAGTIGWFVGLQVSLYLTLSTCLEVGDKYDRWQKLLHNPLLPEIEKIEGIIERFKKLKEHGFVSKSDYNLKVNEMNSAILAIKETNHIIHNDEVTLAEYDRILACEMAKNRLKAIQKLDSHKEAISVADSIPDENDNDAYRLAEMSPDETVRPKVSLIHT